MQKWVLPYLCCPNTGESLKLIIKDRIGDNIINGKLISKSGKKYPIINGVPRFIKDSFQKKDSVDSFGFQWNTLNFDLHYKSWKRDIAERNFGSEKYFKDKFIVECGAGSGMHTKWMLEAGAKKIIALELSNTVDDMMQKNLKGFEDKVVIIQADISNPPIKKNSVKDLVYCFNVIQHTKDPLNTTAKRLYSLCDKGCIFAFNVYMTRSKIYLLLDPHRTIRKLTVKLNKKVLLSFSYFFSLFSVIPLLDYLMGKLILLYSDVPKGENYIKRKYLGTVLNTYDYYGSHSYQYIYTPNEIEKFFNVWKPKAKIKNLDKHINSKQKPGEGIILTKL